MYDNAVKLISKLHNDLSEVVSCWPNCYISYYSYSVTENGERFTAEVTNESGHEFMLHTDIDRLDYDYAGTLSAMATLIDQHCGVGYIGV